MRIQWLGHSAFMLEESTGAKVVTDPYDCPTTLAKDVDVVTISCNLRGHNCVSTLSDSDNATIIKGAGAYEIDGIHIVGINSSSRRAARGNIIFKFRIDGVDVCHLGAIDEECNIRIAEAIGAVNILLIPVGGGDTIDAEQAKEYVDYLMPDVVIPMRYKDGNAYSAELDKLDKFLRLFDEEQIDELNQDYIECDRSYFEDDATRLKILTIDN